jgi:hypothetical protein
MPTSIFQTLRETGQLNITAYDDSMAVTQFIAIDPDSHLKTAVSDPRKAGKPAAQFSQQHH